MNVSCTDDIYTVLTHKTRPALVVDHGETLNHLQNEVVLELYMLPSVVIHTVCIFRCSYSLHEE